MTIRTDIIGLSQFGSSAQTIALADVLSNDTSARNTVRSLLKQLEEPTRYSNQDGDRRAHVATMLAHIIRKYDGPKIY